MIIECLIAEGSNPIGVHGRLNSVYVEDVIDVSSVRLRVRHFKSGENDIGDRPPQRPTIRSTDGGDQK
jgi:hypothetical protein